MATPVSAVLQETEQIQGLFYGFLLLDGSKVAGCLVARLERWKEPTVTFCQIESLGVRFMKQVSPLSAC